MQFNCKYIAGAQFSVINQLPLPLLSQFCDLASQFSNYCTFRATAQLTLITIAFDVANPDESRTNTDYLRRSQLGSGK